MKLNGTVISFVSFNSGDQENFSCEVFEDGGEVHDYASTDALSATTNLNEAGNSADWKLESSLL